MKVAFITGGLRPGADGVGDYTSALAGELVRQGHESVLLALNDWNVAQPIEESRAAGDANVRTLRLPQSLAWVGRLVAARRFLDGFGPDWVSWQFVSYAYNPRGFVNGLAPMFSPFCTGRRVQLFLHELWIGMDEDAGIKERLMGCVQRHHLLKLIRALRPDLLQTNNPTYVEALARHGLEASALPLFGNVPVSCERGDAWLLPLLRAAGLDITSETRSTCWLFGLFGSLHEIWPPEPLLSRIREAAARQGKRVAFVSIGRLGPGEALWQRIARDYAKDFVFLKLGLKSAVEISQFLNTVNFGVATSPMGLINKSGTVAAMLEHDLPVIVNRTDRRRWGIDREPLEGYTRFIQMDKTFAERLAEAPRRQPQSRLGAVGKRLLETFDSAPQTVMTA